VEASIGDRSRVLVGLKTSRIDVPKNPVVSMLIPRPIKEDRIREDRSELESEAERNNPITALFDRYPSRSLLIFYPITCGALLPERVSGLMGISKGIIGAITSSFPPVIGDWIRARWCSAITSRTHANLVSGDARIVPIQSEPLGAFTSHAAPMHRDLTRE